MPSEYKTVTADEINAISQDAADLDWRHLPKPVVDPLLNAAIVENNFSESYANVTKIQELLEGITLNKWRALYLARSFYLVGFVLYVTITILAFCAVGLFSVSDAILITLLTTTLAHVLGILFVAFKWLYKQA